MSSNHGIIYTGYPVFVIPNKIYELLKHMLDITQRKRIDNKQTINKESEVKMKVVMSVVNNPSECDHEPTKMLDMGVGSPSIYAFVRDDKGHTDLWMTDKSEVFEGPNWCEVTDLTGIPVWEYMKLKQYAIAVEAISKDADSWKI